MNEQPQISVYPRGLEDEFPDGLPTAAITHHGCRLILRFADGDLTAEGPLQELLVLPETGAALEPRALRRFAPQAERYLAYARAAMRIWDPGETPERRWEDFRGATQELRQIAGPGRLLSNEFYGTIAKNYAALVSEGEPHPVKALSEIHHVTISAASRWVKGAKERFPEMFSTEAP
jgi:hypothetical protein